MVSFHSLVGTAAALFSIIGTVSALDAIPTLPSKISQVQSGKAYGYRKKMGTYLLSDQLEFSWD